MNKSRFKSNSSSVQTGLKYLKVLAHSKRQGQPISIDEYPRQSIILERLQRTSALSTNYYAPLPSVSTCLMNRSIQADDLDELSFKTATNHNHSYAYFYKFSFSIILLVISCLIVFSHHLFHSYPIHCFIYKNFWHPKDLLDGFRCHNTEIDIHFVEIYSSIYQLEIKKNTKSKTCLGFDILSCSVIDYSSVPRQQIIRRNDQLIKYCNHTAAKAQCNHSLNILPYEYKWNLRNHKAEALKHCSCFANSNNSTCFHFRISYQCDIQIPWVDYCLKQSTTSSICEAYIKKIGQTT